MLKLERTINNILIFLFIILVSLSVHSQKLHTGNNVAHLSVVPKQFSILNWNIHKATNKKFEEEFQILKQKHHILITQEILLNQNMQHVFSKSEKFEWHVVESWLKGSSPTGVGTISKVKSLQQIPLLAGQEPLVKTPKTSLITTYKFANNKILMVINTHALLLASNTNYSQQMDSIITIAKKHLGPMIWAGDFNTWKQDRWLKLKQIKQSLRLNAISFPEDNRSFLVLDHILYRGLKLKSSKIYNRSKGSDHLPLSAHFEL